MRNACVLGDGWWAIASLIEGDETEEYDDCQPIPLTEEWLVKLGFEYDPEDETWFKGGYYFTKNDEGNLSILEFPEAVAMYVHQLQNLYFALTGKELQLSN